MGVWSFSMICTEANEQAGGALGWAIRSAEQNESARIARRTRAKGGAAHGCAIPRRSVRQANGVRVPRQRREDARPKATPDCVITGFSPQSAISPFSHYNLRHHQLRQCSPDGINIEQHFTIISTPTVNFYRLHTTPTSIPHHKSPCHLSKIARSCKVSAIFYRC
jgi:hypothetical protein